MTVHHQDDGATILHGDCLDILATLPDASVDAVVTDPPYGLSNTSPDQIAEAVRRWTNGERDYLPTGAGFMGKAWDAFVPPVAVWDECLRVLKPGGHLLTFAGTRTVDLMTLAVRLAGFEIRDSIAWMYGSGFPKSLDVSKAIDKVRDDRADVLRVTSWLAEQRDRAGLTNRDIDEHFGTAGMAGHWTSTKSQPAIPKPDQWLALKALLSLPDDMDAEVWRLNGRKGSPGEAWQTAEVVGVDRRMNEPSGIVGVGQGERVEVARELKAANSDAAKQWSGWGTALKPAFEPIVVARKPLVGTVNIMARIEHELRQRGITGEIEWTRPANGVGKRNRTTPSGTTQPQPTAGTSARTASASGTRHTGNENGSNTAKPAGDGVQQTRTTTDLNAAGVNENSAEKSSPPTAGSVPAAENGSRHSSPSTTSTAAELNTARQSMARSTQNSADSDSLPGSESFAGIATGLTGSRAHVRIDRNEDGTFTWPADLPEVVKGPSTVAANVLQHGTGALNIDGCRIDSGPDYHALNVTQGGKAGGGFDVGSSDGTRHTQFQPASGRWPANVILDESQAAALDEQSGTSTSVGGSRDGSRSADVGRYGMGAQPDVKPGFGDTGGASRFFYVAKAPKRERPVVDGVAHPTVKPLALMRWLIRLVTPPGGTVLEPFAGSGTTVEAALLEGVNVIGIEREAEYLPLIRARIDRARREVEAAAEAAAEEPTLFDEGAA